MKYWQEGIIVFLGLGIIFLGLIRYNEDSKPEYSSQIFHEMDHAAFDNIKAKCGVLDTDLIYTTSLRKISDCLKNQYDQGYTTAWVDYSEIIYSKCSPTNICHTSEGDYPPRNMTAKEWIKYAPKDLSYPNLYQCQQWCRS